MERFKIHVVSHRYYFLVPAKKQFRSTFKHISFWLISFRKSLISYRILINLASIYAIDLPVFISKSSNVFVSMICLLSFSYSCRLPIFMSSSQISLTDMHFQTLGNVESSMALNKISFAILSRLFLFVNCDH